MRCPEPKGSTFLNFTHGPPPLGRRGLERRGGGGGPSGSTSTSSASAANRRVSPIPKDHKQRTLSLPLPHATHMSSLSLTVPIVFFRRSPKRARGNSSLSFDVGGVFCRGLLTGETGIALSPTPLFSSLCHSLSRVSGGFPCLRHAQGENGMCIRHGGGKRCNVQVKTNTHTSHSTLKVSQMQCPSLVQRIAREAQ